MPQRLITFLKSLGSFGLVIVVSTVLLFLFVLFFGGAIRVYTTYLSPLLQYLDGLAFLLSFIFLFLCVFRKCRIFAGTALVYCSYAIGIDLWFQSLVNTDVAFGLGGVFIGIVLLGIGIYFTGLAALLWAHLFATFWSFVAIGVFMIVIRSAGLHIVRKEAGRRHDSSDDSVAYDGEKTTQETLENLKESGNKKVELKDVGLYAAMVVDEKRFLGEGTEHPSPFNLIDVYLVNETNMHFPSVKVLTGAFASDDDNLIETGKSLHPIVELKPHSAIRIDGSDTGELDFVVWYQIDVVDDAGKTEQFQFSLLKYRSQHESVHLPLLDKVGHKLELEHRGGPSIDEWVETHDMKSRYLDYGTKTSFSDFN